MTSPSRQRGPEKAHMHCKWPCYTALHSLCSRGSSRGGRSLGPPKKCGGQGKPVLFSNMGSSWVAELQVGLASHLLLLLYFVTMAGGLEVEMAETQTVSLHDSVTISCKIPGSRHLILKHVAVFWFQNVSESEVQVFEYYRNQQKAVRPGATVSELGLTRGDASLHLPRIELKDAGEYRCMLVVTPEKAEGKTRLEVVASPDTRVFVKPATVRNRKEAYIICQLDRFYPEAFTIKWETCAKNGSHCQEVTEGKVTGPIVRNEDGTFSVTSSLAREPALEDHQTVYQCVVSHSSLLAPQTFNVTLSEEGSLEICVTIGLPSVLLISVLIAAVWNRVPRQVVRSWIWSLAVLLRKRKP